MSAFRRGILGANTESQHSRLWALRTLFFGVLIYDLIAITFKHAARYGVDGFNVAQFTWLDAITPVPDPALVGCLWATCALAAVFATLNIYTTTSIRTVAILYAGVYFWSQIDSYQHHYLIAIIAVMLALMPSSFWTASAPEATPPRGTLIGLLYIELGIVYLWTAIAKLDQTWLSGSTLMSIGHSDQLLVVTSYFSELIYGTVGDPALAHDALYQTLAVLVIAGELVVAICYICPPLRTLGLVLAPTFHLSVEFLGLDIELFSIYMIGINLILLSPNQIWVRLDKYRRTRKPLKPPELIISNSKVILMASTILGAAMLYQVPFGADQAPLLSMTLSALVCSMGLWTWWCSQTSRQTLLVSLGLVTAGLILPRAMYDTGAIYDYHRMLGGDLARRLPQPSAQDYEARLKQTIDVYGVANAAMPDLPARRAKQARLILKGAGVDRLELASKTLAQAHQIHLNHIGHLERKLERVNHTETLEALIKTQLGLASVCKELRRIPPQSRALSDRQLALTLKDMRESSARLISRLASEIRQRIRSELEPVLMSLRRDGRFDAPGDQITADVSGPPGPGCEVHLMKVARWSLQRSQMRLGRKDKLRMDQIRRTAFNAAECSARFSYALSPIISARLRRSAVSKLSRSQKRVFGK
jgi:hypothetical protein